MSIVAEKQNERYVFTDFLVKFKVQKPQTSVFQHWLCGLNELEGQHIDNEQSICCKKRDKL